MTRLSSAAAALALILSMGCTMGERGPEGPAGPDGLQGEPGITGDAGVQGPGGPTGATGDAGAKGATGCTVLPGETLGLNITAEISQPANGTFFTKGERPVVTLRFADRCGGNFLPSELGTANLYLAGPRGALLTRTPKMLNAVEDRAAADHQHHFINLKAPSFKDPSQNNVAVAPDGTVTFTFGPVTDEAAGTYAVGVWGKSVDELDQQFPTFDLQIGTAQVQPLATGNRESATCLSCHLGSATGKVYLAHTHPGYSPKGNFAIDSGPTETCVMCHNNDGYSRNPIVRKVHGLHRGEHQLAPGAEHPDYGLVADTTLAEYTNVGFPANGGEKDCLSCHVDDRWKTQPSRLACGTCHDNVRFDTGTLSPPRVQGKLANNAACTSDAACSSAYGSLSSCNVATGSCERKIHPVQTSDIQCVTCHTPDRPASGLDFSIAGNHEIPARTQIRGLQLTEVALSGGSVADGSVTLGDKLTVKFRVKDRTGASVTDLLTNASLSGTVIVAGPNDDPRRVIGSLTMAKGSALTYDAAADQYSYTVPTGFPSDSLAPFNNPDPSMVRANPSGSYSLYFYVVENLPSGARDSVGAVKSFRFVRTTSESTTFALRGRQVISAQSCNACHVDLQLHGGSRSDPEACFTCHNTGAMDKTVGSTGAACTTSAQCAGNAGGWESCVNNVCTITQDPTPNQTVSFGPMVHQIHFARLRDGYAERENLVAGGLPIIGYRNSVNDFGEVLFPLDIRNCQNCHANAQNTCTSNNACGFGQQCSSGKCVNVAWKDPSANACLSCHDTSAAYAHAALNTVNSSGVASETCDFCHAEGAAFSSSKVHEIAKPYVPPYAREKQ